MKDYFIYAPFDGIIDKINVDKSDFVSSGTILGTIITKNKIADISFNEIDIAKIKVGQEAILTFDAFDNLKIKGKVIEISTTGTEEQGVVSYNAKISIEEDNQDIKPGMSVNADIIVNKKENVLMVPNLAIRKDKDGQYVEVIKDSKLKEKKLIKNTDISQDLIEKRYIKTGIYDNEFTEVLDGLNENDNIIIKTSNQKININNQKTNPFLPRMPFGQQRR
jgi:HlyD family secretion protein